MSFISGVGVLSNRRSADGISDKDGYAVSDGKVVVVYSVCERWSI
jgi:hypothetical protein